MDIISPFLAACHVALTDNGGLMTSLAVAGLVGGFSHCAGMCGPFVLAQTTSRLADVPVAGMTELTRLKGAFLLPYHLGRMTTYSFLGSMAGLITAGLGDAFGLKWLSAGLLTIAGLFFLAYGAARLGLAIPAAAAVWSRRPNAGQSTVGNILDRVAKPLFSHPSGWRGYLLGGALGFLPCGMLYGAIAGAASAGSTVAGAFAMAFFALGTIPGLLAVGLAGHFAGLRWRTAISRTGAALMVVNGGVLGWLAWTVIG